MTSESSVGKNAVNGIRTAFGVGGLIALVVGILILVWPGHTASVITAIIALYAIVVGLVYAGLGIFARTMGGWSRLGHIVLGVLFIIGGVIALTNLRASTVWFAVFLGIFIGIMWIVEGVVALTTLAGSRTKAFAVVFAILSIVAGVIVLLSPLWSAVVLWWLFGISLVVLGIVQIVRAFALSATAR
ncbi:MAG TPA: DUF308 domain-containing protein [Microbacterium sp.]|uniref:HdeD family acid-resistance protein n=1 Tax=Microbacterium sp. TaxID=51671 RepID=UPI002B4A7768|nr:DUF308 domain-containing protein [Microbacterium sp.]HKT57013.1 DUF308 domain-containing protein [Microbacterium sp.]